MPRYNRETLRVLGPCPPDRLHTAGASNPKAIIHSSHSLASLLQFLIESFKVLDCVLAHRSPFHECTQNPLKMFGLNEFGLVIPSIFEDEGVSTIE